VKEENHHLLFWAIAFLFSLWGGLVRYFMDHKSANLRISKRAVIKQIIISVFTGFLGGLYSFEYGHSIYLALITVGLSSTLGSPLLRLLWTRLVNIPDVKIKK
jgi:hypothetical protein